jgi:hypothetical protein
MTWQSYGCLYAVNSEKRSAPRPGSSRSGSIRGRNDFDAYLTPEDIQACFAFAAERERNMRVAVA